MTKYRNFRKRLTATLWFVPTLLALCGVLLALVLVGVDMSIGERLGYFPRLFGVEPSGSRDMLAIIAGSSITVAGTVFSITIVALTLASTQFSPRILRNFMRDTGNQAVLGVFVGIFAYCIIVLRTIRDGASDSENFVPSIAVVFGVLLGLVSIGFLIYYIHHVATSIQATSIVSQIAKETIHEIEETFPDANAAPPLDAQAQESELAKVDWLRIPSTETGYIQNADVRALVELARKHDLVVEMRRRVGEFAIKGLPLVQIAPTKKDFTVDKRLAEAINEAYDIGSFRTVEGDVAFGLRQIVDISLKDLSPAINDTTTAIICIDYLTSILVSLAKRPSCPSLYFADGNLRVISKQQRFEDFFDLAFNQIRQNAGGNVPVILRLLVEIEVLAKINQNFNDETERAERHELLEAQARLLFELAEKTVSADADFQSIVRRYKKVDEILADVR